MKEKRTQIWIHHTLMRKAPSKDMAISDNDDDEDDNNIDDIDTDDDNDGVHSQRELGDQQSSSI